MTITMEKATSIARKVRAEWIKDCKLRRPTPLHQLIASEVAAEGLDCAPCGASCGTTIREIAREIYKAAR